MNNNNNKNVSLTPRCQAAIFVTGEEVGKSLATLSAQELDRKTRVCGIVFEVWFLIRTRIVPCQRTITNCDCFIFNK